MVNLQRFTLKFFYQVFKKMKPIILVIVGAAMLMPMMRHKNIHYSKKLRKGRARHAQQIELKEDSQTGLHNAGFWIERLP
jgi:hypothetical protein